MASRFALLVGLVLVISPTCMCGVGDGIAVDLVKEEFDSTLAKIPADDYCLVEFFASWCPACQRFKKHYDRIAAVFHQDPRPEPRVFVARVDCVTQGELCQRFDVKGYPMMVFGPPDVFVGKNGKEGEEVRSPRTADGVINWLNRKLGTHHQLLPEGGFRVDPGSKASMQSLRLAKAANPPNLDIGDVEKGTVSAFEMIFSEQALGIQSRNNFVKFVELLAAAHPIAPCRAGSASLLARLDALWPHDHPGDLPTEELRRFRPCGRDRPVRAEWMSCRGSTASTRGYTCGLWLMFHSLAAGLDEGDPEAGLGFIEAMKSFMDSFFGCDECRSHFLGMANKPAALSVRSKKDAVMWLWRSHNLVNARIKKEEASRGDGDPVFVKLQWPPNYLCPECRRGMDQFDEGEMYSFLLRYFGSQEEPGALEAAGGGSAQHGTMAAAKAAALARAGTGGAGGGAGAGGEGGVVAAGGVAQHLPRRVRKSGTRFGLWTWVGVGTAAGVLVAVLPWCLRQGPSKRSASRSRSYGSAYGSRSS